MIAAIAVRLQFLLAPRMPRSTIASKGMNVIRLPFLLQRVEPIAGGPLSATEFEYIDQVVAHAATLVRFTSGDGK
jgi:hypothetical protein